MSAPARCADCFFDGCTVEREDCACRCHQAVPQVDWYEVAFWLAMDLREIERKTNKTTPCNYDSIDRWEAAMAKEKRT